MNFIKKLFGKKHNQIKFNDVFDENFGKEAEAMSKAVEALSKVAEGNPTMGGGVLSMIVEAMWTQRQLDDLISVRSMIYQGLKKEPFKPALLQQRDRVNSDINQLQPIVIQTGLAVADYIEKKYGVQFLFLTGKGVPDQPEEKKTSIITDPKG
jgi:hypothetical protein